MNSILNSPHTLALTFLQKYEPALSTAQERVAQLCISHLVDTAVCSASTARDITMQALGELTARRRPEYIDCSRTTSFALFLVDAKGKRHTFTIADLLGLLDSPAIAATA